MKIDTKEYLDALLQEFEANSNPKIAEEQKAYMKHKFSFLGIMTPVRKQIQKPFLQKENLPDKKQSFRIVMKLWKQPYRELHYFCIELVDKYKKQSEVDDIEFFEWMITTNSWWDTVDMLAIHAVGNYFKNYPQKVKEKTTEWIADNNIWLQRTALLFQLKYKKETDTILLEELIKKVIGSDEFFIRKAIGWVLREYARTDKAWVAEFLENNELSNLSRREAMKHF